MNASPALRSTRQSDQNGQFGMVAFVIRHRIILQTPSRPRRLSFTSKSTAWQPNSAPRDSSTSVLSVATAHIGEFPVPAIWYVLRSWIDGRADETARQDEQEGWRSARSQDGDAKAAGRIPGSQRQP